MINNHVLCDWTPLVERLADERNLADEEFLALLACDEPELNDHLAQKARAVRERFYGKDVYLRGLIEFTNICKNDCRYCGIRRSNGRVERYRLSDEEIFGSVPFPVGLVTESTHRRCN